jgi:hypothetical protein
MLLECFGRVLAQGGSASSIGHQRSNTLETRFNVTPTTESWTAVAI